jgi:hypothetical protein
MLISKGQLARYVAHGFPIHLPTSESKLHCQSHLIGWANNISANIWAYESVISPHGVMLAPGNGVPFLHLILDDNRISVNFFEDMSEMLAGERAQIAQACQGLFVFLTGYALMNNASYNNITGPGKAYIDGTQKKYVN